jgi:hypothetical protein
MPVFTLLLRFLLAAVVVAMCGCDFGPKKPVKYTVVSTPKPWPPARRVASEGFRVEDALSMDDLSFLLRTGTAEKDVLHDVSIHGLAKPILPAEAQSLSVYGASTLLMAAVQDPEYVITPDERRQYDENRQRRDLAARGQKQAEKTRSAAEFEERQRQAELQSVAFSQVAAKEQEARRREQAKQRYEQRKTYLTQEKERIQAQMNQHRQWGYTETQLAGSQQRLKAVEAELAGLKAP